MDNPGIIALELDSTQITANEGSGTVGVTITRSQGSDGTVTVDYRSVNSSAIAGSDYSAVSGTATFNDGVTSQTIAIPILEDSDVEGSESFNFTIDNATGGASLLAPRTAFITIEDNDFLPGAQIFNGNQYLFTSGALTWEQAQVEAETLGGNLVTINDRTEETWLRENFSATENLWMGYNDAAVEGQFEWVSGQSSTYTNWAVGEPNDFNGIQDFGLINFGGAGEWDDESGFTTLRGIIEIGGSNPTSSGGGFGADPIRQTVITGLNMPTAIDWTPDGETIFISEKGGRIRAFVNGQLQEVIDLSAQVNEFQDRGLNDLAVHPDFFNGSPYVYALYTYDPPQVFQNSGLAGPDGAGNRAGRLSKITIDLNSLTAVPGSEEVILGRNSTWNNFNGFVDSTVNLGEPPALGIRNQVPDFLAADSVSHSVGSVEFGSDGALYVSNGDGTSFNVVDPRTVRVQDIDTLSGKILRIDPITGNGLTDNPFYNGDPNSNRSKVYQYGLRNAFRFNVDPDTGIVYSGDVGWFTWEEINVGEPGTNFGWPYFEGGSGTNIRTPDYQFLPEAQVFYNSGQVATPAIFALNHNTDNINAIVGGDIYRGNAFPPEFQGDLFLNDLGQGIVRNISFDQSGNITDVDIFVDDAQTVVQIVQGPDDNLYFVELFNGVVGRWEFERTDNPPTVVNPIADLTVSENAADQIIDLSNLFFDPDGDPITISIQSNSNPSLVAVMLNGNNLNLDFLDDQFGNADITIRGTANGLTVDDIFNITVNENADNPPTVVNPIADLTVPENVADQTIDLSNVFFDPDGDPITLSVQANSNPGLVTPALNGNNLNLDIIDDQFGIANLVIRATANGLTVDDTFILTVNEDSVPNNEILRGTVNDDLLVTGPGNDLIIGLQGNDTLRGEEGNDTLRGEEGNDTLRGRIGDDILRGGNGDDSLTGGTGDDSLNGGIGNDTLRSEANNDSLTGDDGNDSLLGGSGDDILRGNDDRDTLIGGSGIDTLYGGNGADILRGDAGNDILVGGDGNDTLRGRIGDDLLQGNDNNDSLTGGDGDDSLWGGRGDDLLQGHADDDSLVGGAGNDSLVGGTGDDTLEGNGNNDSLTGGIGNDSLVGGTGDDTLVGDRGVDILIGQSGADMFVLQVGLGVDSILDFVSGVDSLELPDGIAFNDLMLNPSGTGTAISFAGNNLAIVRGDTPIESDFI
ncbi:MAG: PQQ-dependent sugar dehydrogenase [Cyanobacteria bacterium P01_F01_bin.143]